MDLGYGHTSTLWLFEIESNRRFLDFVLMIFGVGLKYIDWPYLSRALVKREEVVKNYILFSLFLRHIYIVCGYIMIIYNMAYINIFQSNSIAEGKD